MKTLSTLVAFVALTASVQAQTDSASLTTEASKLDITFSGQVETGVRSDLRGDYSNGANNNVVGGYTRPAFGLDLGLDPATVSASYILKAFGGQGFGDANPDTAFRNNIFFEHNPTLIISGDLSDSVSGMVLTDFIWKNVTGDQTSNETDLVIEPSVIYKINNTFDITFAYFFERYENPDGFATGERGSIEAQSNEGILAAVKENDLEDAFGQLNNQLNAVNNRIDSAIAASVGTKETLHAGRVGLGVNLAKGTRLDTYVRAGRLISNKGSNGENYRLNSDLSTAVGQNLSLKLRYRLNIVDIRSEDTTSYYNRGRVIASYAFSDNLSVDLENEATFYGNPDAADTFRNEQFLGMTYAF